MGHMTTDNSSPIVCTLAGEALRDRLAWISKLAHESLCSYRRNDLVLDLRYAPEAADRVRELVHREQACCAFLTFELREQPDEMRLTISAPEEARAAADAV